MNINDFIVKHTKEDKWISYNESIILPDNSIIEARPSHEMAICNYVCELENTDFDTIKESLPVYVHPTFYFVEKYKLCSIWYEQIIIYPGAFENNHELVHIFNRLIREKLLCYYIWDNIYISKEYTYSKFNNGDISYDEYNKIVKSIEAELIDIKGGKYNE